MLGEYFYLYVTLETAKSQVISTVKICQSFREYQFSPGLFDFIICVDRGSSCIAELALCVFFIIANHRFIFVNPNNDFVYLEFTAKRAGILLPALDKP